MDDEMLTDVLAGPKPWYPLMSWQDLNPDAT